MRKDLVIVWVGAALFGACMDDAGPSTDETDDAVAEAAPLDSKADSGLTVTGDYATTTTALRDGDVPNLELGPTGVYVRNRCYHSACSAKRAETDKFDTFTTSSGKSYLRFWSFKIVPNAMSGDRDQVPVVADTYEITKTSTTIKLRKTYTARWLTLKKRSLSALCTASGGTWGGDCTCPGPAGWPNAAFIAGAGGCIMVSGTDESECDGTNGFYTDDDSTPIGSFCECGVGRYAGDAGCASN